MVKSFTAALPTLLLAWWVNVFSNGQWIHGGVYATVDQCRTAGKNIAATYVAIGYKNVTWLCIDHRWND